MKKMTMAPKRPPPASRYTKEYPIAANGKTVCVKASICVLVLHFVHFVHSEKGPPLRLRVVVFDALLNQLLELIDISLFLRLFVAQ